jgi:uncharacterized protein YaaR (DUF327 family)
MKLQDTPNQIQQIGNITEGASFKMKSSRKAFQILSDLYSDKPLAIVRELGCNANDSMIASGKKDQPFHIHLPNSLEPWITIQDFGTGISHQNIYDIYSTYFESTKTNTNDQIGCLGLGSKSPFCYTDNFSVTSICDGEKRIYNAYFAENGNPTIALMSTAKTSEQNGVAVQIPVKEKDFVDFIKAVQKAFRFFDVKPTTSGGVCHWTTEKPMFSGDDWMFLDSSNAWEAFAIMGGVTYPIDHYKVDDKYNQIVRKGVVLKFAMGELDFAPSREHLSYDDATIKAINDKMEKVTKEISTKAKDQILAKDNIMDAIQALNAFNERFSHYGSSTFDMKDIIYKGHDISEPWKFIKQHLGSGIQSFSRYSYRKMVNTSNSFSFDKKFAWYYDDGQCKNPIARIKMVVRDTSDTGAIYFTEDQKNHFIKIGFPDTFIGCSTLPSPTAKKKIKNGSVVVKAKEDITCYDIGGTYKASWESRTIEPTETDLPSYYIVKGSNWNLDVKLNGLHKIEDKDRLTTYCRAFSIDINKVVLATEKEAKKLKARGVKDFISSFNAKHDVTWIDMDEIKKMKSYGTRNLDLKNLKEFKDLADTNPVKQFIVELTQLHKKYSEVRNILNYLDGYDHSSSYHLPVKANDIIVSNILSAYSSDLTDYLIVAKAMEK